MRDTLCLQDKLSSPSCLEEFNFFHNDGGTTGSILGLSPSKPGLTGPSYIDYLTLSGQIHNKTVGFVYNSTSTVLTSYFGWDNTTQFTPPLVKNHILADSQFMWNINYQGVLYGEDRIRANSTMIWAMVMTSYY